MAMKSRKRPSGEEVLILNDGCPYCDADISSEGVPAHLPCEGVPSTDEVIAALEERGWWP